MSVKALYQGGTGEIVEKKSRFIANLEEINSEEEALAFIGRIKKQYWDARHNCYAYVAGKTIIYSGAAMMGNLPEQPERPMLDVLLKEDIHNTVVVVTRYFGGTLLGTGGLVRAYQKAVQEGLRNSVVIEKMQGRSLKIDSDYNAIGKIQYILAKDQITAMDTSYTDKVVTEVMVPVEKLEPLKRDITEGTNGTAGFQAGDLVEFALIDGKIKIF